MIARSLLCAVLLLVGYNAALLLPPIRSRAATQSLWQDNIVKAQQFLLRKPASGGVLVGSSLSALLPEVQPELYNLAFPGAGPTTGLEILHRGARRSPLVLIESNLIMRAVNRDLLANAFRPVFRELRAAAPAFREEYEPAAIVNGCLVGRLVQIGLTPIHAVLSKTAAPPRRGDLFALNLAPQQEQYAKLPPAGELEETVQRLQACVAELQACGSRCVFYEMPIDASLRNSPRAVCLRERLLRAFPPGDFKWIFPEQIDYPTSDGVHLPPEAAAKYARYLAGALQESPR